MSPIPVPAAARLSHGPDQTAPPENYPFRFSSCSAGRCIQGNHLIAGVVIEPRVNWHPNRKQQCHQPQP
jgi:hypothetical protein